MKKKALVVLAEGFEEIEAIMTIDVLRRANVNVTAAGLDSEEVTGAHGLTVKADIRLTDYDSVPDAVIFPGGMPGAENLAASNRVRELISDANSQGKLICAICASPALVLAPTGILDGKKATCYPGMEKNFSVEVRFLEENVVTDGNIITSRGPATTFPFALKIAENLAGKNIADMVGKQMLFSD